MFAIYCFWVIVRLCVGWLLGGFGSIRCLGTLQVECFSIQVARFMCLARCFVGTLGPQDSSASWAHLGDLLAA